jgi:putative addiction module component (TIGR02574 family)
MALESFVSRGKYVRFFPPGWKPRLHGRQDACRYSRSWQGLFDSLCRRQCYFQTMTASLKSIAETVEQLPAKERAYLAERLIASLDEAELEKEWADEAIRRRDEVRSGKVKAVPAAEVYRRIERLLAK